MPDAPYDPELLDELARVYALVALDKLIAEAEAALRDEPKNPQERVT
jgi:hypothetical protein